MSSYPYAGMACASSLPIKCKSSKESTLHDYTVQHLLSTKEKWKVKGHTKICLPTSLISYIEN